MVKELNDGEVKDRFQTPANLVIVCNSGTLC